MIFDGDGCYTGPTREILPWGEQEPAAACRFFINQLSDDSKQIM